MQTIKDMAKRAREVAPDLAGLSEKEKNRALQSIADLLRAKTEMIVEENERDMAEGKNTGLSPSMLDRLLLNAERVEGIASAVEDLIRLPDPVGHVISGETMRDGMKLVNVRVPLGVCGIIYEARPNVTVDAATLCFKSGNVCLLKGGKEAIHTNSVLMRLMREALDSNGLPADFMQLIEDTSREAAMALMGLKENLDVLIPRGGAGLIAAVVEHAKVPVIETGSGNNHLYVDAGADLAMAEEILINAKTQRPSVCNAIETLLVHEKETEEFLSRVQNTMQAHGVELRGCEKSLPHLGEQAISATEEDWATEFIDLVLAVRVVPDLDEALRHIARYGSGHSEAIVTSDYVNALRFQEKVDAAAVYVNCSTRFTDGGEFGLGAEIGISTQKLHVRGPMGLEALTGNKYLISGQGQIRK